ncbi:unnamed protein product, partial [Didymodactylos carnosus]
MFRRVISKLKATEIRTNDFTWFGVYCQYTFYSTDKTFADIINEKIQMQTYFKPSDVLTITNGTCYLYLKECNRGHVPMCIDWREICDGKLDCLNGEDEQDCWQLEIHECYQETQYRCKNGQCIDKNLYVSGQYPMCTDNSDPPTRNYKGDRVSFFVCEEHYCVGDDGKMSCANGGYSSNYAPTTEPLCQNGRDLLYTKTILSTINNQHLSYKCWNYIICRLNFEAILSVDCEDANNDAWECPATFSFPSSSIFNDHVQLIYHLTPP